MHQGLKLKSSICFLLSIAELLKAEDDGSRFACLACPLLWRHAVWDSKLPRKQSTRSAVPRSVLLQLILLDRPFSTAHITGYTLTPPESQEHLIPEQGMSDKSAPETAEACVNWYRRGTEIQALSERESVQRRIPPSRLKTRVLNIIALQQETETGTAGLLSLRISRQ